MAPYLDLDATTYPAVVDGRVVWVVDGYTSTADFPYSATITSTDAVREHRCPEPRGAQLRAQLGQGDGGRVRRQGDALRVGPEDPILQTWQKVFPSTVVPYSEMIGDLMSHMRYPEDLFSIQRYQLTRYHVTDAADFYSGQDFWANPADPTNETPNCSRRTT